ncbi:hypothetical protein F444_11253 [Phytophthora nicotianae P1976]|uniref:Uncharacterized protein n=1 Tax=Phytophthora nicotianae P1976 TaxID=1317066 RepID=A0A081A1G8_PHYNI|nr:hypothetical protein F444_11253 [Phytophthora nicotianae P1976]
MSLPLPAILTCRFTIKNGDPLTSCRNKTEPIDFSFQIDCSFRLFKAQVATEFIRRLPNDWQDDFSVYLKPTKHAPQREFLELDEGNFSSRVARSWEVARLRLHGQSDFVLMIFVYVPRAPESRANTIRKATENRIQDQVPRVAAMLAERNTSSGPASQLYMATMQARLPADAPLQVPDNTTFRQLRNIDQLSQEMETNQNTTQATADMNFRMLRIKIQGAVIQVQVHVGDLQEILGLPAYSLRPPFRDPVDFETPTPAEDMDDVDHLNDHL